MKRAGSGTRGRKSLLHRGAAILLAGTLLASSAAQACTRFVYFGATGSVITARSMDWKSDIATNLWILPRGIERTGETGANTVRWTAKYGSVIASAYDIATSDGVNDAGEGNVVTGFQWENVLVVGSDNTVIAGNRIGTNFDGSAALPGNNSSAGVVVRFGSRGTRIGANGDGVSDVAERNLISGLRGDGVVLLTPEWTGALPPGGTGHGNAAAIALPTSRHARP